MRIVFDLGNKLRVSPPMFANNRVDGSPADLAKFAPHGNGFYGWDPARQGDPFKNAPTQEASGGVVYFDNPIAKGDFFAMLRLLEVNFANFGYAIFTAESEAPGNDGYLAQMRIVSKFGLRYAFNSISDAEYERFQNQPLCVQDALIAFMELEKKRWGESWMDDERLSGLFGGDGDFAREQLAFGFMQENEYFGIYRIWSRAWLVTK